MVQNSVEEMLPMLPNTAVEQKESEGERESVKWCVILCIVEVADFIPRLLLCFFQEWSAQYCMCPKLLLPNILLIWRTDDRLPAPPIIKYFLTKLHLRIFLLSTENKAYDKIAFVNFLLSTKTKKMFRLHLWIFLLSTKSNNSDETAFVNFLAKYRKQNIW